MFNIFNKGPVPPTTPVPAPEDVVDQAVGRVVASADVAELVAALRDFGRSVIGSDGVTIIRRDGEEVVYVTEDAISPLWSGQRFPIRSCISGMAIQARAPIVIPDIMQDRRVPLNAYIATFVRSMAVVPIGHGEPRMAMGAYWQHAQPIPSIAVERMSRLALAAADVLDRVESSDASGRQVA